MVLLEQCAETFAKLNREGGHSGHFEAILAKADDDITGHDVASHVDRVFERLGSNEMHTQELDSIISKAMGNYATRLVQE